MNYYFGVSGIGAKTAIAMLSNITPSKFALAIISNDLKTLTKIPGIGNKSAQRMVLELKDKLKTETAIEGADEEVLVQQNNNESISEAGQALQILGYNKGEIAKVFDKIETHNLTTEELIKEGKVMVDNEIINILEEQNEDNIKIYKDDDVLIHKQVIDGKEYLDIYLAS